MRPGQLPGSISPTQGPIAFEDFDLTPFLTSIIPGRNVLAIQGLNASAGNPNFLIQPQLLGRSLVVAGPAAYLYPPNPRLLERRRRFDTGTAAGRVFANPGVYTSNTLAVTLASTSGRTIRFTIDGSAPDSNSPVYTSAIQLTTNCTLRARAELGGIPGPVSGASYILLDSTLKNFSSNLPLVIVDTLGQVIPAGSKIGSYAVFIRINAVTAGPPWPGAPITSGG